MKLLKQEVYGLTKEASDVLCADKDKADYFEHVMIELGIDGGHYPVGCKLCEKDKEVPRLLMMSRLYAKEHGLFFHNPKALL